jgi:Putative carbonic anhydrase
MATGTFGTAINCMDGRVQTPIADWVKMHFSVTWVDMITEPGADGVLAHGPAHLIESIHQRAHISVQAHGSGVIVVAGHDGCAGNPVSREQHLADIRQAMRVVAGWGFPVRIVGLFVNEWGLIEEVPVA